VADVHEEARNLTRPNPGTSRAGQGPGFTLAESFKWGAVSFKFRKKPPSYQVDCPNRNQFIRHAWGSTTTCSKTTAFNEGNKELVVQRLKTWAVAGLDCETRDDHVNLSGDVAFRPVGKLLSPEDLEEKCPKQVIKINPPQLQPRQNQKRKQQERVRASQARHPQQEERRKGSRKSELVVHLVQSQRLVWVQKVQRMVLQTDQPVRAAIPRTQAVPAAAAAAAALERFTWQKKGRMPAPSLFFTAAACFDPPSIQF